TTVQIPLEALALLDGIGELVEAVRQLHAIEIELEPLGHARHAGADARERRAIGGIVVHEAGARATELRSDDLANDEIEQRVALTLGGQRDACALQAANAVRARRGEGVDRGVALERGAKGDALHRVDARGAEERTQ